MEDRIVAFLRLDDTTMTRLLPVATLVAVASLGACSSTSHSVNQPISVPETVRPPVGVTSELAPYLPRFVNIVQGSGFTVAQTSDPRALELRLDFDPSKLNMRVTASLVRDGVPIVTAEARNAGFGTVLAMGASVANLVEQAEKKFAAELRTIHPRLTIVPDQTPAMPQAQTPVGPSSAVEFASVPPNAEVWLDGQFIGTTPLQDYPVAAGQHRVELRLEGYVTWERMLLVQAGARTRLSADLQPAG